MLEPHSAGSKSRELAVKVQQKDWRNIWKPRWFVSADCNFEPMLEVLSVMKPRCAFHASKRISPYVHQLTERKCCISHYRFCTTSHVSAPLMKFLQLVLVYSAAVHSGLAQDPAFTYRYDTEALSPPEWVLGYPKCGGSTQSPVDITESKLCSVSIPPPVSFAGACTTYNMTVDSEAYKAAVDGGDCTATLEGESYNFAQFHVHTPSEHTIDGKAYDGEIHFVHKKEDGSAALVVGLFLQKSNQNDTEPAVDVIVDAMSEVTTGSTIAITLGSYSKLLSTYINQGHVFNYAGSLTTPPCTEFVNWWVIRTPARISSVQFDRIVENLAELEITDEGKNARPVQPLNGRTVTTYN